MAARKKTPASFDEEPAEQEIDTLLAARRDELAAYTQTFQKFRPIVTREEFDELYKMYSQTENPKLSLRARDTLLYGNYKLVLYFALRYKRPGISLPDLIQEGLLGAIRALERFEPKLGIRFSTYASYWIKHMIRRYFIDNVRWRVNRLPVYITDRTSLLRRAINAYQKIHKNVPNDYELWKFVRTFESKLAKSMTLHDVVEIRKYLHEQTVKLDSESQFDDGNGSAYGEAIADARVSIEDTVAAREMLMLYLKTVERIKAVLAEMPPRDGAIILERLGLNGENPTLESLGSQSNICRERVRQIEQDKLRRLSFRTSIPVTELKGLARTIEELERIVSAGR